MKYENINTAFDCAKRFLDSVITVNKLAVKDIEFGYRKETAALKRASLDLTRALAKMRNDIR